MYVCVQMGLGRDTPYSEKDCVYFLSSTRGHITNNKRIYIYFTSGPLTVRATAMCTYIHTYTHTVPMGERHKPHAESAVNQNLQAN